METPGQLLSGIRILDLSIMTAGPSGTQLLGDLGADVIKIEQPGSGDYSRSLGFARLNGVNTQFLSQNRNKRSMTLNLRHPRGKEIFFRLVPTADVIVENFRPSTVSRLGVDYDRVREIKPDILYVSISAFGQTGPYSRLPANDPVIQAIAGLMALTGEQGGGPVRVGNPAPDFVTGTLMAYAIMAGLLHRHRTGKGQKIELSLLDATLFSLLPVVGDYFASGQSPPRMGSAHRHFAPSQSFTTADGKLLYLSIFAEEQWPCLCAALGHPEWEEEPRYKDNATRLQHRDRLAQQIQACLQAKSAAYWAEQLDRFKIPWAPVNTVGEALHDPQVLHNGMIVTLQHQRAGTIRVIGHPVKFSQTPARYTQPPPELGEHTESLLQELRYSAEEIHRLRREKVI